MTSLSPLIQATLCVLLWGSLITSAVKAEDAGNSALPTGTLVADGSLKLTVVPQKVDVLSSFVYVIGEGKEGPALVQLDANDLKIQNTVPLDFNAGDLELSFNGEFVYVIGERDGNTDLAVFSKDLELLGTTSQNTLMRYPSLSMAENGILIAVGMSDDAAGVLLPYDVSEPTKPALIESYVPDDYAIYGASGAWLDNREKVTFFLNVALLPSLVAFGVTEKGIVEYSDISFQDKSVVSQPLTTHGIMPGRFCPPEDRDATFLISSQTNRTLFLVSFDPAFRSLDVLARTPTNLRFSLAENTDTYSDTDVLRPTSLLDSSCDHGVIWVANKRSAEIEQFAVNYDSRVPALEKVGQIRLETAPTDIAISTAGRAAFVISADRQIISRYSTGDSSEVIGTEVVRELQRLLAERGYPVGAIDGQIGVKTLTAVQLFEERNEVKLDIRGDLDAATVIIRETPVKYREPSKPKSK